MPIARCSLIFRSSALISREDTNKSRERSDDGYECPPIRRCGRRARSRGELRAGDRGEDDRPDRPRRCRRRVQGQAAARCWPKWRICAGAPSARSPIPAPTAFRRLRAISWVLPTTWRAASRRSMPELRESADAGVQALLDGVELTERELAKVLEKHGVKKFDPAGREVRSQSAPGDVRDAGPFGAGGHRGPGGAARLHDRRARAAAGAGSGGERRTEGCARAEAPANDNAGAASDDPRGGA